MKICGLNKTTLLDYPGKVAATIFLGGCNYRCPFCQNSSLVLHPQTEPTISEDEVLRFLKKRQGILEGVCITGGEPTLSPELPSFIKKLKELNYAVKLDTNGTNPALLKKLVSENLLDMIAMDIKSRLSRYPVLCGLPTPDLNAISESAEYLLQGNIDYEFRTTVVKELHTKEDFIEIRNWISGAKAYYLQAYKDSGDILQPGFTSYAYEELQEFQQLLSHTISKVEIRGID